MVQMNQQIVSEKSTPRFRFALITLEGVGHAPVPPLQGPLQGLVDKINSITLMAWPRFFLDSKDFTLASARAFTGSSVALTLRYNFIRRLRTYFKVYQAEAIRPSFRRVTSSSASPTSSHGNSWHIYTNITYIGGKTVPRMYCRLLCLSS